MPSNNNIPLGVRKARSMYEVGTGLTKNGTNISNKNKLSKRNKVDNNTNVVNDNSKEQEVSNGYKFRTKAAKLAVLNGEARNCCQRSTVIGGGGLRVKTDKELKRQTPVRSYRNAAESRHQPKYKNGSVAGRTLMPVADRHLSTINEGLISKDTTPPSISVEMLNSGDESEDPYGSRYAYDIIEYWLSLEIKWQLPADYLSLTPDISPRTRGILINWIIQVAEHLSLLPETLEFSISMIDRYVASRKVKIGFYQLLGVTCLFVASKYEERFVPEVSELIRLTDHLYTHDQLIRHERTVLKGLSFRVFTPVPSLYVATLVKHAEDIYGGDVVSSYKKVEHLARYILTLSMTESTFSIIPASVRASAAVSLALELIRESESGHSKLSEEPISLITIFGDTNISVRKCMVSMATMILKCQDSPHQGAKNQFASDTYDNISDLPILSDTFLLKRLSR